MEKQKQLTKPQDLDEEELDEGIENINVEVVEPISQLPPCMPPRKPT